MNITRNDLAAVLTHTSALINSEKRGNVWNIDSAATHGGPITIMDVESEDFW